MALKLVHISRVVFSFILLCQGFLLVCYPVKYEEKITYVVSGVFSSLAFAAALFTFGYFLWRHKAKGYNLIRCVWLVWLLYSIGLVVMIGVIFGGIVIKDRPASGTACSPITSDTFCGTVTNGTFYRSVTNGTFYGPASNETLSDRPVKNGTFCCAQVKNNVTIFGSLRIRNFHGTVLNRKFFGPNVLKTTLSLTPALMLLLLKSVKDDDGDLKALCLGATLDLFDGLEMLEVLLERQGKPETARTQESGIEIIILVVVIIFYLLSFLELLHLIYDENTRLFKRVLHVNSVFQFALNVSFLVIRCILWFKYNRDAAIFIAKNVISLVMSVLPIFIKYKWISED